MLQLIIFERDFAVIREQKPLYLGEDLEAALEAAVGVEKSCRDRSTDGFRHYTILPRLLPQEEGYYPVKEWGTLEAAYALLQALITSGVHKAVKTEVCDHSFGKWYDVLPW